MPTDGTQTIKLKYRDRLTVEMEHPTYGRVNVLLWEAGIDVLVPGYHKAIVDFNGEDTEAGPEDDDTEFPQVHALRDEGDPEGNEIIPLFEAEPDGDADARLPLALCAPYDDAADWCARQPDWEPNGPLPPGIHPSVRWFIQADLDAFADRVNDCRYAIAMERHAPSEEE